MICTEYHPQQRHLSLPIWQIAFVGICNTTVLWYEIADHEQWAHLDYCFTYTFCLTSQLRTGRSYGWAHFSCSSRSASVPWPLLCTHLIHLLRNPLPWVFTPVFPLPQSCLLRSCVTSSLYILLLLDFYLQSLNAASTVALCFLQQWRRAWTAKCLGNVCWKYKHLKLVLSYTTFLSLRRVLYTPKWHENKWTSTSSFQPSLWSLLYACLS